MRRIRLTRRARRVDHLVRAYHHTYGLRTTTSNCSNNYGPFHFPEKLIPLLIVNILHGRALPIYGDGRNIRDWLYVEDHCRGIDLILSRGKEGEGYNIGGRAECENLGWCDCCVSMLIARSARVPICTPVFRPVRRYPAAALLRLIEFVTDRPGHDRRYAIDSTKIERELGFFTDRVAWRRFTPNSQLVLDNTDWWQRVMDGRYQEWIKTQYQS